METLAGNVDWRALKEDAVERKVYVEMNCGEAGAESTKEEFQRLLENVRL